MLDFISNRQWYFIQDNTFDSTGRLMMVSAMLAEGITDLEQFWVGDWGWGILFTLKKYLKVLLKQLIP